MGRRRFCPEERSPVIVLGNQKSGTSAIASLLGKATGLSYVIDISAFWGEDFKRLHRGEASLSSAVNECYRDFSNALVKEPNLTFLFDGLREVFPKATFVFVVREPTENIRSIAERLKMSAEDLSATSEVTHQLSDGWRGVFEDPHLYGAESTSWGCGKILARRWQVAADVYLNQPEAFELIRYEDFVQSKSKSIHDLATTLGLNVTHDISAQVDVAYQPPGKKELVVPESVICTYRDMIAPQAAAFGYDLNQPRRRSA